MKKITKSIICIITAALLVMAGFGIANQNNTSDIRMCDLDYEFVLQ